MDRSVARGSEQRMVLVSKWTLTGLSVLADGLTRRIVSFLECVCFLPSCLDYASVAFWGFSKRLGNLTLLKRFLFLLVWLSSVFMSVNVRSGGGLKGPFECVQLMACVAKNSYKWHTIQNLLCYVCARACAHACGFFVLDCVVLDCELYWWQCHVAASDTPL